LIHLGHRQIARGRRQPPGHRAGPAGIAPAGAAPDRGPPSAFGTSRTIPPQGCEGRSGHLTAISSGRSPSPRHASIKVPSIKGFGGSGLQHNALCTAPPVIWPSRAQVNSSTSTRRPWPRATAAGSARASAAQALHQNAVDSALGFQGGQGWEWRPQTMSSARSTRSDSIPTAWLQNIVPVPARSSRCGGAPPPAGGRSKEGGPASKRWPANQRTACHAEEGLSPKERPCPRKVACPVGTGGHQAGLPPNDGLTAKSSAYPRCGPANDGRPPTSDPGRSQTWACPQTKGLSAKEGLP